MNKNIAMFAFLWIGFVPFLSGQDKSQMSVYLDTNSNPLNTRAFIIDPKGRRLGHDIASNSFLSEIPGFGYNRDALEADDGSGRSLPETEEFLVQPIIGGTYSIAIHGFAASTYTLTVLTSDINHQRIPPLSISGFISKDDTLQYELLTETALGSGKTTIRSAFFNSALFSSQLVASCGSVTVGGGSKITGDVHSGGIVSVSGNATITGNTISADITTSGNGRVQGAIIRSTAPFDCSPVDLDAIQQNLQKTNDNSKFPSVNMVNGVFTAKGNDQVTILAGNYLLDGLMVTGNAKVTVSGPAHILVRNGAVKVDGNGVLGGIKAGDLMVFSNSAAGVDVAANGRMTGVLYAPQGPVKVEGSGKVAGAVFGKTVEVSGDAQVAGR